MKFWIALLSLALVSPMVAAEDPPAKVRVTVTEFTQVGESYRLRATVAGGTSASQMVVLVRYAGVAGYRPASDVNGFPVLPKEESQLSGNVGTQQRAPVPSSMGARASVAGSAWLVEFQRPSGAPAPAEVYAVVCNVQERSGWSRAKDYRGFQYLPFDKARTIDDALNVLRDFGWTPVGLTRVESNRLNRVPLRSVPVR